MPKPKPISCSPFSRVDPLDPFNYLPLLSDEIKVDITFEETKFNTKEQWERDYGETELKVYTNSGRRISGQCVCKLKYSFGNNVTKEFVGVSSVSESDEKEGLFSYFEGRALAFGRAIRRLPLSVRRSLVLYFLRDDEMNGNKLDFEEGNN